MTNQTVSTCPRTAKTKGQILATGEEFVCPNVLLSGVKMTSTCHDVISISL